MKYYYTKQMEFYILLLVIGPLALGLDASLCNINSCSCNDDNTTLRCTNIPADARLPHSIIFLDISYSDVKLYNISRYKDIQQISAEGNNLSTSDIRKIYSPKKLVDINLSHNCITSITICPWWKILNISYNPNITIVTNTTNSALRYLSAMYCNYITFTLILPDLIEINLVGNHILHITASDIIPTTLNIYFDTNILSVQAGTSIKLFRNHIHYNMTNHVCNTIDRESYINIMCVYKKLETTYLYYIIIGTLIVIFAIILFIYWFLNKVHAQARRVRFQCAMVDAISETKRLYSPRSP